MATTTQKCSREQICQSVKKRLCLRHSGPNEVFKIPRAAQHSVTYFSPVSYPHSLSSEFSLCYLDKFWYLN